MCLDAKQITSAPSVSVGPTCTILMARVACNQANMENNMVKTFGLSVLSFLFQFTLSGRQAMVAGQLAYMPTRRMVSWPNADSSHTLVRSADNVNSAFDARGVETQENLRVASQCASSPVGELTLSVGELAMNPGYYIPFTANLVLGEIEQQFLEPKNTSSK